MPKNLEQSRQTYQPGIDSDPSEETLLDAMCIWEAMIEARQLDKTDSTNMSKVWENWGTWQMRQYGVELLQPMRAVFLAVQPIVEDSMAYDWEFVPLFLSCVRWPVHDSSIGVSHPDADVGRIVAEITARVALKAEPSLS